MANEENRDDSDGSFHHAQMSPLELGINGSSHSPDIETMVQAASEGAISFFDLLVRGGLSRVLCTIYQLSVVLYFTCNLSYDYNSKVWK